MPNTLRYATIAAALLAGGEEPAAEHAAGVRYYDVLISGSLMPLSLLNAGILEPVEPLMILLMGGSVGFVVFSILMPIMEMNDFAG